MAVTPSMVAVDLALVLDNGNAGPGQPMLVTRTFKKVKTTAANADIYAVAQALLGLQTKTIIGIQRRDIVELIDLP
jgi:predicted nucleotidyltransferase